MWRTNRENLSTGRLPLKTTCTRDKIVSKRYQPSYILITIPENYTLATIDVKSLYLNIPHEEGKKAVLNRLYHTQEQADQMTIPPGNMKDLLDIVLKQNYFQFADKMYHQVQGTAMGTKMAPSYANIFMAELEEQLYTSQLPNRACSLEKIHR